ncbi:MAG: hypothetical protein RMM06_08500 [Armatimonadota bacterium]|nr:hypothetical protein [bacterium]MCS7310748.1 hypothetical protein [Armatimonadota bacterium]MDW8290750.1 hypothetical protein [Armatimonadota bacterium]
MKREVSPVTAAVVIIVVMLIVGAAYWFFAERRAGGADVPAVPPDVQAEFQRRMGGMTPGGQPALSPGR